MVIVDISIMFVIILKTYSLIVLLLFLLAWVLLWKDGLTSTELIELAVFFCVWPLLFPLFIWSWIDRLFMAGRRRRIRRLKV